MPTPIDDVLEDLVAEYDHLESVLQSLTPSQWTAASAAPGWTVADTTLHLALTEEGVVSSLAWPEATWTTRDRPLDEVVVLRDEILEHVIDRRRHGRTLSRRRDGRNRASMPSRSRAGFAVTGYGAAMPSRLERLRAEYRSTLTSGQQRGVSVLAWLSIVILVGLTTTGVWQFFAHESDPSWFDHTPGSSVRQRTAPSEGAAELHGLFGSAGGVLAMFGGAWFAYKVLFDVPRLAVLAFGLALVGLVTGSLIRFNAIKLEGRQYEDAGRGYGQLFVSDVDYVVTDKWDLGAMAIRLFTVAHIATVPILLAAAWFGTARVGDTRPETTVSRGRG
jgi:hypothetical protein